MKAEHIGIYLKLNKGADKDIIQRLKDQDNKQGYIKDLIRTDISLDSLRNAYKGEKDGNDNSNMVNSNM